MRKILFAASECVPFIKTGGLADVCGALPKEFDQNEWDIRVVIPNYTCIPEHWRNQFEYVTHFYMSCGNYIHEKYVGILREAFVSMDRAQNMLVIKTVSGMAMAVGAALDNIGWKEIVGCIAGDDTVMCAIRTAEDTEAVMAELEKILRR